MKNVSNIMNSNATVIGTGRSSALRTWSGGLLASLLILLGIVGCAEKRVGPGEERVMIPAGTDPERWGDFVIAQDTAAVTPTVERQGPRRDLTLTENEGPFDSRLSSFSTSKAAADSDSRVPLLEQVPAGEEFFGFTIVSDSTGAGDAWAHYIRPSLRTVALSQGSRPAIPMMLPSLLVGRGEETCPFT